MKKAKRNLIAVLLALALSATMAGGALALDNIQPAAAGTIERRAQICPACNDGMVRERTERIRDYQSGSQGCAHGHYGYADAIQTRVMQKVRYCTNCRWSTRGEPFQADYLQCLRPYACD